MGNQAGKGVTDGHLAVLAMNLRQILEVMRSRVPVRTDSLAALAAKKSVGYLILMTHLEPPVFLGLAYSRRQFFFLRGARRSSLIPRFFSSGAILMYCFRARVFRCR